MPGLLILKDGQSIKKNQKSETSLNITPNGKFFLVFEVLRELSSFDFCYMLYIGTILKLYFTFLLSPASFLKSSELSSI